MLRRCLPLLALTLGCQAIPVSGPGVVEERVATATPVWAPREAIPCAAATPDATPAGPLDLPALWALALANNPTLREAAADVEAARGRWIQAGKYPNPHFLYDQDTIGSRIARQGNIVIQVNQEIVTAGKRHLDQAVARQETTAAAVGLDGRKFETLTRVRRGYYDYLGLRQLARANAEAVRTLERGIEITRRQVEVAKTRPQTDLIRLEALLEEARINQARTQDALDGAWRQLAAEVGVLGLAPPEEVAGLSDAAPAWDLDGILRRALATNTAVRQARVEVERARLAVERARAEAVPNVTVGGGYGWDNVDMTAGAQVTVEAALPVWDRKQGLRHEARAKFVAAQAAVRSAENRLSRDAAEAFARYQAANRQVERLARDVLPRLQDSLDLLLKAYQAGSAQVTFSDVLTAEQSLNGTRVTLAEARRSLWQAVADLQGLMQIDVREEWGCPDVPAAEGTGEFASSRH